MSWLAVCEIFSRLLSIIIGTQINYMYKEKLGRSGYEKLITYMYTDTYANVRTHNYTIIHAYIHTNIHT